MPTSVPGGWCGSGPEIALLPPWVLASLRCSRRRRDAVDPQCGLRLSELVAAIEKSEPARWPVWFPKWHWSSEHARAEADRLVQRVLDGAAPAEVIVAWNRDENQVAAAARVPPAELSAAADWFSRTEPIPDWFKLLGLPGAPSRSPAA